MRVWSISPPQYGRRARSVKGQHPSGHRRAAHDRVMLESKRLAWLGVDPQHNHRYIYVELCTWRPIMIMVPDRELISARLMLCVLHLVNSPSPCFVFPAASCHCADPSKRAEKNLPMARDQGLRGLVGSDAAVAISEIVRPCGDTAWSRGRAQRLISDTSLTGANAAFLAARVSMFGRDPGAAGSRCLG